MRTYPASIAVLLTLVATVAIASDKPAHAPADHSHAPAAAAPPTAPPAPAAEPVPHAAPAAPSADDALKLLNEGNDRFVAGAPKRPNQNQSRLCDTFANGQHPFAAVLSCADSRVPPELIFDTGIGDLFVIRIAGNVADVDEVGSLEYGVEHLGINLIVVMGHAKCGAVTAVVDKAHVTPNIEKLVDNIVPAAESARRSFPQLAGPRLVEKAIRANVRQSIVDLSARSELLRERFKSGKLKAVGCVYNLHTGEADWLEPSENVTAKDGDKPGPSGPVAIPVQDPHASPRADPHGHSAAPSTQPDALATAPAKDHNYVALGGLLGSGAVVSYAVIHFVSARRA